MVYSAVIFDLDGLILDTEIISRTAWECALADFGFELTDQLYQNIIGLNDTDIEKIFRSAFGEDFPLYKVTQLRSKYLLEYLTKHPIAVKPGFLEVLALLDKARIPRAVATSSSTALAIQKLTDSNLIDRFDAVVCGDQIRNGKPAPDIFLTAAKKLHVPPERCLVFEDSENGIRAAHTAGMASIMIPDLIQPSKQSALMAHRVFPSMHEAIPFLQEVINVPA
jgi:beta-phosphoglucomutase family hydrolase